MVKRVTSDGAYGLLGLPRLNHITMMQQQRRQWLNEKQTIIPDPYFVMYKHLVNLNEGKPAYLDTYAGAKVFFHSFKISY